jgi:alcohol dehydrogenase YqhD (iron-dependent ADH family)
MNFTYQSPGKSGIRTRENCRNRFVDPLRTAEKALIVTGTSSTRKSGLLDRTVEYLKSAGVRIRRL